MDAPMTCGQGLAEHSALPAKLAELMAALAAPESAAAFAKFVAVEQELLALLQWWVARDEGFLADLRGAVGTE